MDKSKPLIRALNGESADRPPFWFMRQAGRYLPEYREVREQAGGFLELCYTPEFAIEVTLQPIRRFGMDGAILFSDILVVPDALGVEVSFEQGEGPKLTPIRDSAGLAALSDRNLHEHLAPVYETISGLRAALPSAVTLIGFAGAPWTLAAYMTEGGGSKDYEIARSLARRDPAFFSELIDRLSNAIIAYLDRQIESGAEAIQLFDSWAGVLAPDERERWCIEPLSHIVNSLREMHPYVPVIVFPRNIGAAYSTFADRVELQGLSFDTSVDPAWAATLSVETAPCLQGNLDPMALLVGGDPMLRAANRILDSWRGRPFIFNLGHGVVQATPPEHVAQLAEHLKSSQA